ncbi:TetR/AcrR family transcriptional regulator [Tahibacter amnicola]|uniref:TetR family transcriptional regulator C-terminal domain-containing protein n=1 Tax=Tahibacter amnicola TaxID=2976241 RepID=A0ABY6BJ08_9GAMM|nr:TetR/AcrR family transcriptional regulator [Tahibacter amnicola]UXI69472.1 TetR family transcriptional regulator C-terminal domain-containing protein [Tahibacter amnicola]
MAREKSFDIAETTREVMHVFRRRGYEATSIKDLEAVTGLKAGSLYNTFGNKHELFLTALDYYIEHIVTKRIRQFLSGDDPIEDIRALFVSTYVHKLGDCRGCLLTNTAVEIGNLDERTRDKVIKGMQAFEVEFERLIKKAQRMGLVRAGRSAAVLARHLLLNYQGLLVMVKLDHSRKTLNSFVDGIVESLRA